MYFYIIYIKNRERGEQDGEGGKRDSHVSYIHVSQTRYTSNTYGVIHMYMRYQIHRRVKSKMKGKRARFIYISLIYANSLEYSVSTINYS